jgi:hypothetical protein
VKLRKATRIAWRMSFWMSVVGLFFPLITSGQGAAPETAPPLFPGGELFSYNSIFTTRGFTPGTFGDISATARPTFSHEADFNFTWGFYRDFDLTVLIPVTTNHFDRPGRANHRRHWSWRFNGARKIPLLPARFAARHYASVSYVWPQDSDRAHRPDGCKWKSAANESAARLGFH